MEIVQELQNKITAAPVTQSAVLLLNDHPDLDAPKGNPEFKDILKKIATTERIAATSNAERVDSSRIA